MTEKIRFGSKTEEPAAGEKVPSVGTTALSVRKRKTRRITTSRGSTPRHKWGVSMNVTDAEEEKLLAWAKTQNEPMSELVRRTMLREAEKAAEQGDE